MIERCLIYLFCAFMVAFLLMGCSTQPLYVCQRAQDEQREPVLLCMPVNREDVTIQPGPPKPVRKPDVGT